MAAPCKLNKDSHNRIVQAIRLGATYEHAAKYGGVAYNTFNEWMKEGAKADGGAKRELYEDVKKAEGDALVGWLAKIEKAATDGNWQAAAWKTERRYPDDYGRRIRTEITGAQGGAIEITARPDISDFTKEELKQLEHIAQARLERKGEEDEE
jgi:hypothetical protein